MRVLFLHASFPGIFRLLAHAFGARPGNTTLFLAESGQRAPVPGVRRLRLAPPLGHDCEDPAEREIVLRFRRGARAGNAMLRLRKDGFVPDLICASSSVGGSLYVRDIFPQAFYMVQADWFYTQGESHSFFTKGRPRPPADFAPARIRNLWEYNALGDCDLAVTSSQWQRDQYPDFLSRNIEVLHSGINTKFFSPAPATVSSEDMERELVTFSGPQHDATRGFAQFTRCLPRLLELRPRCRVLLAWPETSRDRSGRAAATDPERHDEELSRWRANLPLTGEQRERVYLQGALPLNEYRRILRASSAHVYLTAPYALSTGILEALACGALVVGSDTAPVREVLRHGENGFLCDFWDADNMAEVLAGVLDRAPRLAFIRQEARRTVLREYDAAVQTQRLMELILRRMGRA